MDKKIMVESLVNGRISIDIPDLHLKRTWEKKGAKKPISLEDLQEAIYNTGFEYMLKNGILGIEDMEAKIALGLEPEGAKEPVNIIILTDAQKKRLLTVAPLKELSETIEKLGYEQRQELADFAIRNEITNMDRCEIIKKAINIDVMRAVILNRQAKED